MKKITLLFILFLSFNQIAKAQSRLHLADSNAVWTVLYSNFDAPSGSISYSVNQYFIRNNDTFINGTRYSILYEKNGYSSTNINIIGYIGEDSLKKVILYFNDYNSLVTPLLKNIPLVIADFSKNINDSIEINGSFKYFVANKGYRNLRGDSINSLSLYGNMISDYYGSYDSTIFYDRIGDIRYGILHPFLNRFENGYQLICYKENGIELAPDSCDFTLNLNEKDYSNNQFDISTNIINNYLLINFNSLVNVNQATIILYDLNGKEILNKHIEVNNNLCFVSLENLINGMYVLQMKIPNSKVDIRKKIILTN